MSTAIPMTKLQNPIYQGDLWKGKKKIEKKKKEREADRLTVII